MAPLPGERVGALLAAAGVLSYMCAAVRTGGGSVPWNAAVSGSRFGAGRRSDGTGLAAPCASKGRAGAVGLVRRVRRGKAQRRRGFCSAKGVPERSAWCVASGAGRRSDGAAFALQKACRSGRGGITCPSGQAQRRRGFCSAKGVPERSGRYHVSVRAGRFCRESASGGAL